MKKLIVFVLAMMLMAATGMAAQDKGTPAEARAMVKKAVAYVNEVGKDRAIAEFNNSKGKFIYKDLYVWATAMDGTNLSHPYTPALIGRNMMNLKDADGKLFVKERIEIVKAKGKGAIQYRWTNQQTKKVEKKEAYFERVPGTDMFVNCGYYK